MSITGDRIHFSVLTAIKGNTQKRIIPDSQGKPVKDAAHKLGITDGRVEHVAVDGPEGFAEVVRGLGADQALTLGVTGSDKPQRVLTIKELAKKLPRLKATGRADKFVSRSKDFFNWTTDGYFPLLFDHDPEPGHPDLSFDDFWKELLTVFPEFGGLARVVTVSSSSAIYTKATGECLKPASGHHTYTFARGDVKRFKAILEARCWLAGKAFFKLANPNSESGAPKKLPRFLTDTAVLGPERLVYDSGAEIPHNAPIEQRLPDPQVFAGGYLELDSIPDLTHEELDRAAANRQQARDAISSKQLDITVKHVLSERPELKPGEAKKEAKARIKDCDRGTLTPDHIIYLADGGTLRAGEIGPNHDRVTLRDPQEPDYRGGAVTAIIYCDKPGEWLIHSQAHGGANYRPANPSKRKAKGADSTKAAARAAVLKRARAILEGAKPKAHHESQGRYVELPELPDGFGGYAMEASMGAGKTTTIGRFIENERSHGAFTLGLTPRNSLGKQAAEVHGVPHIHHFCTDPASQQALGAMARSSGGSWQHINSLMRIATHIPATGLNVVIDEAMATLTEALQGGTLKKRYSETIELLLATLRQAQAIILSESGLDAATIALIEGITGRALFVVRHIGQPVKWHCTHTRSAAALWAGAYEALRNGQRVWFTTTSKQAAHELAIWAGGNGIKYALVTGDTNEGKKFDALFSTPDEWLSEQGVQLLITTQTVQTGLSVTGDHFDLIFGYGPSFAPDQLYQMIGRYRRPVKRVVWVPPFIKPDWWERPKANNAMLEMDHEVSQWCGVGFNPARKDPDQALIDSYLAARGEVQWALKVDPRGGLQHLLESGGHSFILSEEKLPKEIYEEVVRERAACKETLARVRANDHASAGIDPDYHTPQWVKSAQTKDTTYLERCILFKLSCLEKFPGIDWDSSDVWYHAWFAPTIREKGEVLSAPVAPGAKLWAECDYQKHFHSLDLDEVAIAMLARLRSATLLPNHSKKLGLLAPLRGICEQLLDKGMVRPGCPLVARLARLARAENAQLERYLRITATDEQSDAAITCKILRKFSLLVARDGKQSRQEAQSGDRQWCYRVSTPELWQPLVAARKKALEALQIKGEQVGTDLYKAPYYKSVPTPPSDIPPDSWVELGEMVGNARREGKAALELAA